MGTYETHEALQENIVIKSAEEFKRLYDFTVGEYLQ